MINFIHISDTHLGFCDLDIQDDNGNNIREEDVYFSFRNIVDIIIEQKPDFVIHAGDIFHRSSPTNRALIAANQELNRLVAAGIPIYIIAGNHDFPKSSFTKPIHHLFKTVIKGEIFFGEKYERYENDRYIIHALPHINNEAAFVAEASKIKVNNKDKKNILVTHLSLPDFRMDEYGERVLNKNVLDRLKDFDYIALGHWHRFKHIEKFGNVFYSGSTERFSQSEYDYDKGIINVTIDEEGTKTEFIPIKTRNCYKIKVEKCAEKSKAEIIAEIETKIKILNLDQSIVHISLQELSSARYYEISKEDFDGIFDGTLFYSYSKTLQGGSEEIIYDSESFDLREQLNVELTKFFTVKAELEEVFGLTSKLLNEIEEEESNAD